MRKFNRKICNVVLTCATVGALAAAGVGAFSAYLTDTDRATNTFTVGKVQVTLDESDYPGNDSDEVKNIVPNQEIAKNPLVENTGANDAIVFMTVTVPRATVTTVAADGTKGITENTDLFWFKQAADAQNAFANNWNETNWVKLTSKETTTDSGSTYVFGYSKKLSKGEKTDTLFDKVQLKNIIENEIEGGTVEDIVINTYAIQADNIVDIDTTTLDEATLASICTVYVKQNTGTPGTPDVN